MKRIGVALQTMFGCAFLLMLASCGGEGGDGSTTTTAPTSTATAPTLLNGIAASFTNDDGFAAVAGHQNGEALTAITQTDASGKIVKVTGAMLILPDGSSAVVFTGDDGLPERAVFGNVVVLFSNYTSNTVDIAVIAPDGTSTVTRGVSVDANALSQLKSLPSTLRTSAFLDSAFSDPQLRATGSASNLLTALKLGIFTLKVASCAASIASGVGVPAAAFACSSALVAGLSLLTDSSALVATSTAMGGVSCVTAATIQEGHVKCATFILGLAANLADAVQKTLSSQSKAIDTAKEKVSVHGVNSLKINGLIS